MANHRWNGGIIGPANTPTSSTASGVWNLTRAQVAKGASSWPGPSYSADILVIAGAGSGGGNSYAGGGGGGGYLEQTGRTLSSGVVYSVTVGAGGTAVTGAGGRTGPVVGS